MISVWLSFELAVIFTNQRCRRLDQPWNIAATAPRTKMGFSRWTSGFLATKMGTWVIQKGIFRDRILSIYHLPSFNLGCYQKWGFIFSIMFSPTYLFDSGARLVGSGTRQPEIDFLHQPWYGEYVVIKSSKKNMLMEENTIWNPLYIYICINKTSSTLIILGGSIKFPHAADQTAHQWMRTHQHATAMIQPTTNPFRIIWICLREDLQEIPMIYCKW